MILLHLGNSENCGGRRTQKTELIEICLLIDFRVFPAFLFLRSEFDEGFWWW